MPRARSSPANAWRHLTTLWDGGRGWLVIDQLLSSGTNLLPAIVSILLTSDVTVADVAVVAGASSIAVSVARNAIVVPVQLWGVRTLTEITRRSVAASLAVVGAGVPTLALAQLPVGAVLFASTGCGLVVMLESARGIELALNGGRQMVGVDLSWLLLTAMVCLYGAASGNLSTVWILAAYFLPLVVLVPIAWRGVAHTVDWASETASQSWPRAEIGRLLVNGLLAQSVGYMTFGLSALVGPLAAARWQSARVAFRPIGVFVNLLPVLVPGRLSGSNNEVLVARVRRLSQRLTKLVSGAAFVLAPIGFWLLHRRGASPAEAGAWSILVAIEFIVIVRFAVDDIALFAGDRGRIAIRLRVVVLGAQALGLTLAHLSGAGIVAEAFYIGGILIASFSARAILQRL